jgi:hypothetical protein
MEETQIRRKLKENNYYIAGYGLILSYPQSTTVLGDIRKADQHNLGGKLFGLPKVVLSKKVSWPSEEERIYNYQIENLEKVLKEEHIPYRKNRKDQFLLKL